MLKLWHKLRNVGNCKVEQLGQKGKESKAGGGIIRQQRKLSFVMTGEQDP